MIRILSMREQVPIIGLHYFWILCKDNWITKRKLFRLTFFWTSPERYKDCQPKRQPRTLKFQTISSFQRNPSSIQLISKRRKFSRVILYTIHFFRGEGRGNEKNPGLQRVAKREKEKERRRRGRRKKDDFDPAPFILLCKRDDSSSSDCVTSASALRLIAAR